MPTATEEYAKLNPDHLPDHERGHLDNPQEAHAKAAWMLPYLRAGAEAKKRGEDFFGGSDQYERELAALKHFYHGTPSPHSTPEAPVADESPTAPEGLKHGGKVSKKLVSISQGFESKLKAKERMLAGLEAAYEKHPTAKLRQRISEEKALAERIKKHILKVRSHSS